jgi:hypothetical protein
MEHGPVAGPGFNIRRFAMKHRIALILLTTTVLSACASQGPRERDAQAYELYRDFAGAPIDEFTYLGRYDGWRSLGKNVLAVQTTLSDAYLLTVQGPCSELQFADTIALTSTGNTVRRGLDSVRVGRDICTIREIRPVNYAELRKAQREEAARKQARSYLAALGRSY